MKTALTQLLVCGALACTASAEKYLDPDAPMVFRSSMNTVDRFFCFTAVGFPTNVWGTLNLLVPDNCCNWELTSCGNGFVDSYFILKDANGVVVATNDDNRCTYPCPYGPAVLGSAYGDPCLPAGLYSLEFYVYSYRDANCLTGALPFNWDICLYCFGGSADTQDQPVAFQLGDAFPNPFNPGTTITFSLAETADASLKVFNVSGAEVASLVDGLTAAGEHTVVFDGANLTSGVYFYSLEVAGLAETRKMILVK